MRHQTLFKEYVWLVNTIFGKRLTLGEINKLWIKTDMSDSRPMSRSTFNRHKYAIEDIFGIYIDCDRKDGYRYYIGNEKALKDNSIQKWMVNTMAVNNLLTEHKGLHNRVLLEDIPSSYPFMSEVMKAMKHGVKVNIFYQKYTSEPGKKRVVAPYCVKLYRRRWYMLGEIENGEMRIFSLDRVKELTLTEEEFTLPDTFDAELYFKDFVGVMTDSEQKKQHVVVRAFAWERNYLHDLPLHHSQEEVKETKTDTYTDYKYDLVPTSDFIRQLMSRGGLEMVVKPKWLADKLRDMYRYAANMYENEEKNEIEEKNGGEEK